MNVAIILAGGVGSRVGADVPKQFIKVQGKPIVVYTTEIYQSHPEVDAIEVVCHASYMDYMQQLVEEYHLTKVQWITNGGETFLDSLRNGICFLESKIQTDDTIMVHYAAAPFTSQATLTDSIRVCREKGNAVSGIPCFQLMGTRDGDHSDKWVDRDTFIQITCPYSFRYGFVQDLYREAEQRQLLDKVEPHTTTLMQYMGYPLYLSQGDQTNIKITTKEDLLLFEGWVNVNKIE